MEELTHKGHCVVCSVHVIDSDAYYLPTPWGTNYTAGFWSESDDPSAPEYDDGYAPYILYDCPTEPKTVCEH